MSARRNHLSARLPARMLRLLALALSVSLAACASSGALSREVAAVAEPDYVTFENTTNGVVRVYLVSATSEWLLGRVQPAETARLRLPPGVLIDRNETLALSVVPIGAITPGGMRTTGRTSLLTSELYPAHQLLAMRWGLTGSSLYSVIR